MLDVVSDIVIVGRCCLGDIDAFGGCFGDPDFLFDVISKVGCCLGDLDCGSTVVR